MDKSNKVKIAILSNFNIDSIAGNLKDSCSRYGLSAEVFIPAYNQYSQEIIDSKSKLYKFSPEIIFINLDFENLLGDSFFSFYKVKDSEKEKLLVEKFNELEKLLEVLKERFSGKIVISSLLSPIYSSKGIIENKEKKGLRKLAREFNEKLEKLSLNDNQMFIFNTDIFCMKVGYSSFYDPRFSYIADMKISIHALKELSNEYLSYILPLKSISKKCIVLDLDNTLWGGVIGESGLENIKLGPDKEGRPFLEFQKRLLELSEEGIILAINSKNNIEDAMEVIRHHKYMILKENNFACMKINWEDKAKNMREIAHELNIGLDSFVFIDDDPTNRSLIKELIPEVTVVDLPEDSSLYRSKLEELNLFNLFNTTTEDLKRGKMYLEEKKRKTLKDSTKDLKEFIKQLKIHYEIKDDAQGEISRISQLTQKTNQFNLTTKRYSEEDIKNLIESPDYTIKSLSVKDKFGDYGLTGVIIIDKTNKICWKLDSILLSCRILGKDIEFSFIKDIINEAKNNGITMLTAKFIKTKKNIPAKDFLKDAGFELINEEESTQNYKIELNSNTA